MTTATGGFVFRAERGTLEIKTTSEQVSMQQYK